MRHALVVDDDADIRELVAFKLEQLGFEVLTAADGEEGLRLAEEVRPEIVLLDIMMPKLSGIDVCRRLREQPSTAATQVILLTAKAQEADVERGFAVGADDYIIKPFSVRELSSRVQALMAREAG